MPLPLLLIPMAAAAATSATATVAATASSPLLISGAVGGGVALGGLLTKLWSYFKSKVSTPEEHHDSLVAQHRLTEERILAAQEKAASTYGEIKVVVDTVKATSLLTTTSIDHVRESAETISATSTTIRQVALDIGAASATFSEAIPALHVVTDKLHDDVVNTTSKIAVLSNLLRERESAISAASSDASILRLTMDEQAALLVRLEVDMKALVSVAEAQKRLLEEKDNKIDVVKAKYLLFKSEVTVLRAETVRLKGETEHALDNCRFFKQIAEKAIAPKGVAVVVSSTAAAPY